MENNGKIYRITIEAIGEEKSPLNHGAPVIVESDGFMLMGFSEVEEDEEKIRLETNQVVHQVSVAMVAKALKHWSHFNDLMKALLIFSMEDSLNEGQES